MKKSILALALIGVLAFASAGFTATFITIGSGGVGGTYYPLGGAMAEVLTNAGIDVKATSRATSASRENCRLVASGRAHIGMTMGSALYQAITGTEAFEPDGKLPLQILMSMYPAPQHLVTVKGSGITKLEDIKGKKVSVGAPGGGDQILTNLILKAAGIDPEKDFTRQQLTQPEGVMALKDGNVDAVFWNFAAPGSAVMEVAAQREVVMIPLEEELVKKIIADNPFLIPYTIKTGTYDSIKEDIRTIADSNYLVVKSDMDETLAYNLTKTLIENRDKFMNITTQAAHFVPEEASVGITEFVSGAKKYFKEQGIDMK